MLKYILASPLIQ